MLALAIASILAGSVGLIESTHSTDSVVRGRAAYALARTHARDDGTAVARVDLVLTTGATDLRVEIVRGLTSRGWHPAIPSDVEEKLVKLLGDPDLAVRLAVVDGMRHLPRPRAGDLLLAEEPRAERRGPGGVQVRLRILRSGWRSATTASAPSSPASFTRAPNPLPGAATARSTAAWRS